MMTIPKRIFWTTFLTAVLACVAIFVLLIFVTGQTNALTQAETRLRVDAIVENQIAANDVILADYAHWGAAFAWYRAGDEDALYANLGSGAADGETFDFFYMLSPDGTPTHAYVSEIYDSDLSNFIPELGAPQLAALLTQDFSDYPVVGGLNLIGGELAVVSAGYLTPDELDDLSRADIPILIAGKWLTPAALNGILGLAELQIIPTSQEVQPAFNSLPLREIAGQTLAVVTWRAQNPGQAILWQIAPVASMVALILLVGSWWAGQVAATQTAAHLRERDNARRDFATGLMNRGGLSARVMDDDISSLMQSGKLAVIYVDLDRLKHLNDLHGHAVGDLAIARAAEVLKQAASQPDLVARMGGDEFLCLVPDDDPLVAAHRIADHITRQLATPFFYKGRPFQISASIGIALAQGDLAWDALLTHADQAMYVAKRNDTSKAVVFHENLSVAS